MIALPRPLTGLILALLLFCGAVSGTAMSARMLGLTTVEICADATGGIGRVLLDRQGQPVAPSPECPICLATHLAVAPPPAAPSRLPANAATTVNGNVRAAQSAAAPALTLPPARAPPRAA